MSPFPSSDLRDKPGVAALSSLLGCRRNIPTCLPSALVSGSSLRYVRPARCGSRLPLRCIAGREPPVAKSSCLPPAFVVFSLVSFCAVRCGAYGRGDRCGRRPGALQRREGAAAVVGVGGWAGQLQSSVSPLLADNSLGLASVRCPRCWLLPPRALWLPHPEPAQRHCVCPHKPCSLLPFYASTPLLCCNRAPTPSPQPALSHSLTLSLLPPFSLSRWLPLPSAPPLLSSDKRHSINKKSPRQFETKASPKIMPRDTVIKYRNELEAGTERL